MRRRGSRVIAWGAVLALALVVSAARAGAAAPAYQTFAGANEAYEAGEFEAARAAYRQLIEGGADSGWLYYDWGNAALRAGHLGEAIAAYLEARNRLPRAADVEANLAYARKQTRDALPGIDPGRTPWRMLFFWHYDLSRAELLWIALVANGLLWSAWALWPWWRGELLRWVIALIALVLVCAGASAAVKTFAPTPVAVVTDEVVAVHSGRQEDAVVLFELHEGAEVRAEERRGGWVKVSLPDGRRGWLEQASVLLVAVE